LLQLIRNITIIDGKAKKYWGYSQILSHGSFWTKCCSVFVFILISKLALQQLWPSLLNIVTFSSL
jgi:hypothetical protein